jgi:hypothetical protein
MTFPDRYKICVNRFCPIWPDLLRRDKQVAPLLAMTVIANEAKQSGKSLQHVKGRLYKICNKLDFAI